MRAMICLNGKCRPVPKKVAKALKTIKTHRRRALQQWSSSSSSCESESESESSDDDKKDKEQGYTVAQLKVVCKYLQVSMKAARKKELASRIAKAVIKYGEDYAGEQLRVACNLLELPVSGTKNERARRIVKAMRAV